MMMEFFIAIMAPADTIRAGAMNQTANLSATINF